ncbi:MAG TPA: hypothetical protein DIC50_07100, partial [Verrucomicrobia subdivision 3 bacterium]|nr:hypothetical protein [Limisphaerales bacterium]
MLLRWRAANAWQLDIIRPGWLRAEPVKTEQTQIMASFVYVARETASGREIRSSVEAATEQAAIMALLNRNMLV